VSTIDGERMYDSTDPRKQQKTPKQTKVLLTSLGPARKAERARLQRDYDRGARVLASLEITPAPESEES